MLRSDCPESVSGHDTGGTIDGTCTWCRKRDPARENEAREVPQEEWREDCRVGLGGWCLTHDAYHVSR